MVQIKANHECPGCHNSGSCETPTCTYDENIIVHHCSNCGARWQEQRKHIPQEIIPLPVIMGGWHTLYADPPWNEQGGGKIIRGAQRHYSLMKTEAIIHMPVRAIVAPNAHLYLWTTNNFLPDALRVMEAWGFEYVTKITWPKPRFGLGQYFRGQTEDCLFGVRGNLPYRTLPDGKRAQGTTLLNTWIGEHSEKPPEMVENIEKVSWPPYLELFARTQRPNWTSWGNEV